MKYIETHTINGNQWVQLPAEAKLDYNITEPEQEPLLNNSNEISVSEVVLIKIGKTKNRKPLGKAKILRKLSEYSLSEILRATFHVRTESYSETEASVGSSAHYLKQV